jgi:hypothetical protein
VFGLAKLVAAAAMWEGQEWGGYLLAATVALLLPVLIRGSNPLSSNTGQVASAPSTVPKSSALAERMRSNRP